ncbi:protein NDR1-like [Euphorbia lathyris]|uniref:protein NDR1-like n=1 Tax=Euphorbia lathyris TaxID=212925 RepID=UPI0033133E86
MSNPGGGCCRCCCSFTLTLGLTALFLWLSLRPSKPKCALIKFNIAALNQSLQPPGNTTLIFQLRLENTNKDKGVNYDPVNVTFYDSPSKNHTVANFIIPKFYQGHKKKASKGGEPNATGLDRSAVLKAISNGSAVFRVDLATSVKYKILFWTTKRYRIMVGADFNISNQINHKKGIKLSSNGFRIFSYFGQVGVVLINFLVFGLINLVNY